MWSSYRMTPRSPPWQKLGHPSGTFLYEQKILVKDFFKMLQMDVPRAETRSFDPKQVVCFNLSSDGGDGSSYLDGFLQMNFLQSFVFRHLTLNEVAGGVHDSRNFTQL
jgi:hypothetical protein